MNRSLLVAIGLVASGSSFMTEAVLSQNSVQQEAIASWITTDMATGYETRLSPAIAREMPGWEADRWGNISITLGEGASADVVACGLDSPGYSVTQITDEGYLRVHRIGRGPSHPLWDQAFEAQVVRILTKAGPVAGVVARTNGHFRQQHRSETDLVTADDLWIDVGAKSRGDVEELGIEILDPLSRHLPPWSLNNEVAGPDAGARAGCAALVALVEYLKTNDIPVGKVTFVLSAQKEFGWIGLSSLIARRQSIESVAILGEGGPVRIHESRSISSLGRLQNILRYIGLSKVTWISPNVREPGSHMEGIDVSESNWLVSAIANSIGVTLRDPVTWVVAPKREAFKELDDDFEEISDLLEALANLYGVSGHEWSVRRRVLEALPQWAKDQAVVDDIGNIVVEIGPERDTTVFMAHMDEVGYEISAIEPGGLVSLTRKGGAVSSAWEGQTALIHFEPIGAPSTRTGSGQDLSSHWKTESFSASAPPPLRGVFLTRDDPQQRDPSTVNAWFGLNKQGLEELGVVEGLAVTSYKQALRIGPTRFVARSLDDRAGTVALITAISSIDPDALKRKVFFVWSVHEESGHLGALAVAERIAMGSNRIYSVDTFVSSDTPLESPHFAHAILGEGPVLRAIENSGASPDEERQLVKRAARVSGIPLQIGLTQGSTDGVDFAFWGAPNQGLSWPGRYSHSPGEVLDLEDLSHLSRLIVAVALLDEPQTQIN